MTQLFILLGTILTIFLLMWLTSLVGVGLARRKFKQYHQLWIKSLPLSGCSDQVQEFLEEFKPFVRNPPDPYPFQKFDIKAYAQYDKLNYSLRRVTETYSSLPEPNDFSPAMRFHNLTFSGWSTWRTLYNSSKALSYCLDEITSWEQQIEEIDLLKKEFIQFHERLLKKVQRVHLHAEGLKRWFFELKGTGISGLEPQEDNIRWLDRLLDEVVAQISKIPSVTSNKTKISRYRLLISESHMALEQIAATCLDIRVELHRIERAQRWCQIHLEYLQSRHRGFVERLEQSVKIGLDVNELVEQWHDVHTDLQDANTRFQERTPSAFEVLSGSLVNRGTKDSLILTLKAKIAYLEQELNKIEKLHRRATKLVHDLEIGVQSELAVLERLEALGHDLDMSRIVLRQAHSNLSEMKILLDTGKAEAFEHIVVVFKTGQDFLKESKNLRLNFEKQIQELPVLLEEMSTPVSSLVSRTTAVMGRLQYFGYRFNETTIITEELAKEVQAKFFAYSTINVNIARQRELSEVFPETIALRTLLRDILLDLEKLEKTLRTFEELAQQIEVRSKRVIRQGEELHRLSQRHPLEEWNKKFEIVSNRITAWQHQWSNEKSTAHKFDAMLKQVEELESNCLALENLFHQDRKLWNDKIVTLLNALDEMWQWIDLRLKRSPIPSVRFHDLKKQATEYKKEAKKVLADQFPEEMMTFTQHLDVFVQECSNQKNIADREEVSFRQIVTKIEDALAQADDVKHRIQQFYQRVTNSSGEITGWLLYNETSNAVVLFEELEYQKKRYAEVHQQSEYLPISHLIFALNESLNVFREIRRRLVDELKALYDAREMIKSLSFVLSERIQDLEYRKNNERLRQHQKEDLERQLEGVRRLREKAKGSSNLTAIITLLDKAIELAEMDLPELEVTNQYVSFAERQINLTGGLYNEGVSFGPQVGGNLSIYDP